MRIRIHNTVYRYRYPTYPFLIKLVDVAQDPGTLSGSEFGFEAGSDLDLDIKL
jgi:hypothetical protein